MSTIVILNIDKNRDSGKVLQKIFTPESYEVLRNFTCINLNTNQQDACGISAVYECKSDLLTSSLSSSPSYYS
jgi:hypothetical protein